jgi:hypothetical protein
MSITHRLLTYSQNDFKLLNEILDDFLLYQSKLARPIRNLDRSEKLVSFVKEKFVEKFEGDMYISAKIEDDKILDVAIGTKLHTLYGPTNKNRRPEWLFSMIYSKEKDFYNPNKKIFNTGSLVVRRMEEDKFYTFWQCMKFPDYKTNEECINFIKNIYEKTIIMDRYTNILEYVLTKDRNVDEVPFSFYKGFLINTTRNRNMCICSHHLKAEYRKFIN